jgi:hypothetical protein
MRRSVQQQPLAGVRGLQPHNTQIDNISNDFYNELAP